MSNLKFKFKMPDDETLARYISIKGEKGEKGDPTKLSQLENDTGFVTANTNALANYYTKAQTNSAIDADVEALETMLGVPDSFFTDTSETISGEGQAITLNGTANAVFKDIKLYGDTRQDGTPTPENPVDIEVATGDQAIIVSDNNQNGQSYSISLGNIKLCKIGNYHDYIYKSGNSWYMHKEIGEVELALTTDWAKQSNGNFYNTSLKSSIGMAGREVLCNCLDYNGASSAQWGTAYQIGVNSSGNFWITTGDSSIANLEALQGWFENNEAVIYYALSEPVEEEITSGALILQLKSLAKANSYNGSTVATANGELSVILRMEAFKNNWNGTIAGLNDEREEAERAIAEFLHKPYYFDNVAAMKAYNLTVGDMAITAGYYSTNDGGVGSYKIVDAEITADGGSVIELNNGLKAQLIIEESSISVKQFGAKIDNSTDDSSYIQAAIDYIHSNNLGIALKLNAGTYKVSNTLTIYNDVAIVLDGNVTLNTTTTNVAIHLLQNNANSASVLTWIRGNGQLKIVNTVERASSGIGVKLEATAGTLNDIDIDNLNIRNFETDFKLVPLNVWNIRFNNCIFYHAVKGFEYQRDTITQAQNSGERISFEDCLFTQNDSDVKINGRLISQMNFHNCSFDFSNCIFNIPYSSASGYLNSMNKVSMSQCHVEGICDNIDNLASYAGAYGILYIDGSYDLSFSMSDCTWVVYTDATYFNVIGDARKNCAININNIYVLNDITTPSHLFWSNRPAQMNINAENVNYRILHSVINNHSGDRVNSLPFAVNTILNSNPLFENLEVGSYGTSANTVIGDYKITEVSGISAITCSASGITSNSKKLTIDFDPDFNQSWYAVLNLESTKFTPINRLKPIALQSIINYINNLGLSFTIKWYDAEFSQISTFFDYGLRSDESNEDISLPLASFAVYPPAGACFCKFNYTINGKKSGNDVSRELEGLMLYYL